MRQEIVAVLHDVDVIAMPTGSTFGDAWDAETVVIRGRELPARSRAVYRNGLASLVGHPTAPAPGVMVAELSKNSLQFALRAWGKTSDYEAVRSSVLEQIKLTFNQHDIAML